MKLYLLIPVLFLLSLAGCKPQKAIDFKASILHLEDSAKNIVLAKESIEEKKLQYLIKHDFKGAMLAVQKEEQAFNDLLKEIQAIPADGIKLGDSVKIAATEYYTILRDVFTHDKKEIPFRELAYASNPQTVSMANDRLLELTKEKLKLHEIVNQKDEALQNALKRFSTVNGI